MTMMQRRSSALAILAALAAVALAACSGSGSSAPRVASLGTSSAPAASASSGASAGPGSGGGTSGGNGGSSTRATIAGNVTPLLNEWAACERSNGDPQQTDPTIDAGGVIYIAVPQGAQPAGDLHERTGTCSQYLAEAQNELRAANPVPPPPDQAEYLKYVNCMRTNGVPDYPYPTGDTTNFYGTGVDPNSPAVERVDDLCGKKLGLPTWWINGTNIPGNIEVSTAGMPAPTPQACFYRKVDPCPGLVTASGGNGGSGGHG
ncbi:MAG: hypothetical protein ACRDPY_41070 [Streptosporangiaceae bacterium]